MYVRLAADWTGPDRTRHHAGDVVEIDNVTLAELEAGGFVATEEEQPKPAEPEPADTDESTADTDESTAGTDESKAAGKDKGDGVADPKQTSWPPVG
ncbi:MAG TPA: hypothetical protein VGN37_13950 [Actinocatenispora sp.]